MKVLNRRLSVLILSVNGLPGIGKCMESLDRQSGGVELEVIVANRSGEGVAAFIREKYPWARLIDGSSRCTLPQLQALAFRESSGDVVAMLEDHCTVERDWAERVIEAHQGDRDVIGGSIENAACEKLVDWAAFFCEYSRFMPPVLEKEVQSIPAANATYKRWVVEQFLPDLESGIWDFVIHERIRSSGMHLYASGAITVHHHLSGRLGWFLSQKFHFARSFAGRRFSSSSRLRRALYGAGTILLPFMLAQRIIFDVGKKRKHLSELTLSFPIILLLILSWGFGEGIGYIFGPGTSPAKVK
jgi:hypothetical protein